jgi:hypothetical protein
VRNATSKFHLHLDDPLTYRHTEQALGHVNKEIGQRWKRRIAKPALGQSAPGGVA